MPLRENLKTTGRRQKQQTKTEPDPEDALPPHSNEAEQGVLGCILLDPSCLYQAEQRIRDGMVFFDLRHQEIWKSLVAMGKNGGIDLVTLQSYLKKRKTLEAVGGLAYLAMLPDVVPSAANLGSYLAILDEKWKLRRTMQLGQEISARAQNFTGSIEDFLWATRSDLNQILEFDETAPTGRVFKPSDLAKFDTRNDGTCLIGNRWLCKAGKCLIVGPSGRGKSTLNAQMAILWAMGKPFMGIKPVRPLRQVIIGDENDQGDLAEMFQGVCAGLNIDPLEHQEDYELLEQNLSFFHCPALSGDKFLASIQNWFTQNPVDMAWLDPLVSYADVDITKQEGAAKFLRQGLSRIASESGVCWMVIHHTPKTSRDPRSGKSWQSSDYQYAGAGSYDISGWARAVMTLREVKDRTFCLLLPKRGERSGATHPDGSRADRLWIRHASEGIYWEQVEPPEEAQDDEKGHKGGKPSSIDRIIGMNLAGFCQGCKSDGEGKNAIAKRLELWLNENGEDISSSTCKRAIEKLASSPCNKLKKRPDGLYVKGSNA